MSLHIAHEVENAQLSPLHVHVLWLCTFYDTNSLPLHIYNIDFNMLSQLFGNNKGKNKITRFTRCGFVHIVSPRPSNTIVAVCGLSILLISSLCICSSETVNRGLNCKYRIASGCCQIVAVFYSSGTKMFKSSTDCTVRCILPTSQVFPASISLCNIGFIFSTIRIILLVFAIVIDY